MLEIYNDEIRYLLSINHVATQDADSSKYNIKHNGNGSTHVSDLIVVAIMKISEVSSLLRWAAQNRSHTCSI
jgi:kinesin family member C1